MRISERVVLAFFAWTSILAISLSIASNVRLRILVWNVAVLFIYLFVWRFRRSTWMEIVRDWLPQALVILAYKEMGWFAPAAHAYLLEHKWIVWDRVILDDWHIRAVIEALGPVLPTLLELAYVLVYALPPAAMATLYGLGGRGSADTLLTIYLLGMFLCYGQFPFWPSEPPRTVFPGHDLPHVTTWVRDFSLWVVGSYGIHTSVFPSAHVSGAVAIAFGMAYLFPKRRLLIAVYGIYAAFVATATIYGRYHYAIDAIVGAAVGVAAYFLGKWFTSRGRSSAAKTQERPLVVTE